MNWPPVSAGIPNPGVNVKSLQPVFVLSSKLSSTRAKARQSPDNQAMTPETNRNRPTRGEYLALIRREVSWNCQSYDRNCTESQTVCRLATVYDRPNGAYRALLQANQDTAAAFVW